MTHFDDLGKHCSHPYCNQRDFLPIACDLCAKVHCRDHVGYEEHDCPHKARRDKRVMLCPLCDVAIKIGPDEACELTWERHAATLECARAAAQKAQETQAAAGGAPAAAPPKPRCPAKGCKEKLTSINSYTCATCRQTVCMKHRFEDTHACKDAVAHAAEAKRAQAAAAAVTRPSCGSSIGRPSVSRRGVASLMRRHFLGGRSPMGKAR